MPYNITSGDKKAISYFSSPFVNEIWIGKVPILYFISWFIFLDLSIPKMYAHFTKYPDLLIAPQEVPITCVISSNNKE
tara:strand:- start:227 stop:460 length:234 start_codon:yes stop_codon:yes gene_type:complete